MGWNLSLGASEQRDDLSDPWSFLTREFLEEMVVLRSDPTVAPLERRRFHFENYDLVDVEERAARLANEHLLERAKDGMVFETSTLPIRRDPRRIDVTVQPTLTSVIIDGDTHSNVLVCVNLLELGIEVVKVVRFALDPEDYLLDGEVYQFSTGSQLVRMPMALISLEYLRRAFGPGTGDLEYEGEVQPHVCGPAFTEDNIHIFPFDAKRRRELAQGGGTEWETKRYSAWMGQFGREFFDADEVKSAGAPPLFTPAAAKLLACYFADPTASASRRAR